MAEEVFGIVYNLPASAGTLFSEASRDVLTQVACVEASLGALGHRSVRIPFSRDLDAFVQMVRDHDIKMVFNLCETVDEDPRLCAHPAAVFELLGLAFTGSPSTALMATTDKLLTKRILSSAGVATPAYAVYDPGDALDAARLKFPVIVKPLLEDASIGIAQESVAAEEKTLRLRLADLSTRFGTLLIEEYIAGREFNLSLMGYPDARLLPVAEIDFAGYPADAYPILDYKAKWDKSSLEYRHSTRKFPTGLSAELQRKLTRTARTCFRVLMLRDYGRIDLRMDSRENLYVLEANANPCLSPDAGFAAAVQKSGLTYDQMVTHFINFMKQRSSGNADTAARLAGQK